MPCTPTAPVGPVGPVTANSRTMRAGWLVLALSLLSNSAAPPPLESTMPWFACIPDNHDCTTAVTSTAIIWAVADAVKEPFGVIEYAAGAFELSIMDSVQAPHTVEKLMLPAVVSRYTNSFKVARARVAPGGVTDATSNCRNARLLASTVSC